LLETLNLDLAGTGGVDLKSLMSLMGILYETIGFRENDVDPIRRAAEWFSGLLAASGQTDGPGRAVIMLNLATVRLHLDKDASDRPQKLDAEAARVEEALRLLGQDRGYDAAKFSALLLLAGISREKAGKLEDSRHRAQTKEYRALMERAAEQQDKALRLLSDLDFPKANARVAFRAAADHVDLISNAATEWFRDLDEMRTWNTNHLLRSSMPRANSRSLRRGLDRAGRRQAFRDTCYGSE
jgi:hypothetical protein